MAAISPQVLMSPAARSTSGPNLRSPYGGPPCTDRARSAASSQRGREPTLRVRAGRRASCARVLAPRESLEVRALASQCPGSALEEKRRIEQGERRGRNSGASQGISGSLRGLARASDDAGLSSVGRFGHRFSRRDCSFVWFEATFDKPNVIRAMAAKSSLRARGVGKYRTRSIKAMPTWHCPIRYRYEARPCWAETAGLVHGRGTSVEAQLDHRCWLSRRPCRSSASHQR